MLLLYIHIPVILYIHHLYMHICTLYTLDFRCILSFRNPPGSSALFHPYQNIHQKMLLADLHCEVLG